LWSYSQQGDIDHLLLNLRIDATMVKEQMHIKWAAETGLVDTVEPIVAAYKEVRGLQVRILYLLLYVSTPYKLSALTLLVGQQERYLLCKMGNLFWGTQPNQE